MSAVFGVLRGANSIVFVFSGLPAVLYIPIELAMDSLGINGLLTIISTTPFPQLVKLSHNFHYTNETDIPSIEWTPHKLTNEHYVYRS